MHFQTAPLTESVIALPTRRRLARHAFRLLAVVLVVCVAVQVGLAGLSLFVGPSWWVWHRTFGHLFAALLLAMLGAAYVGRMPRRTRRLTVVTCCLLLIQGGTAALGGAAGAVHPVNALLIFWASLAMARSARMTDDGPT